MIQENDLKDYLKEAQVGKGKVRKGERPSKAY